MWAPLKGWVVVVWDAWSLNCSILNKIKSDHWCPLLYCHLWTTVLWSWYMGEQFWSRKSGMWSWYWFWWLWMDLLWGCDGAIRCVVQWNKWYVLFAITTQETVHKSIKLQKITAKHSIVKHQIISVIGSYLVFAGIVLSNGTSTAFICWCNVMCSILNWTSCFTPQAPNNSLLTFVRALQKLPA